MKSFYHMRMEEEIKKKVSLIVIQELADPRIGFVTISKVSLTRDHNLAKIFITVLNAEKSEITLLRLNNAARHIRWLLAQRIKVRNVPKLQFYIETSN